MIKTDMTTACAVCPPSGMEYKHNPNCYPLAYKPRPSRLCSGCKDARYCSRAHQKLDWAIHGTVCKQFSQLEDRPSPSMRRALYFPVDKTKPEFRWMTVETQHNQWFLGWDETEGCTTRHYTSIRCCSPGCSEDGEGTPYHQAKCHEIGFHSLTKPSDEFSNARVNKCIRHLTGGAVTRWKGPVLAFANKDSRDLTTISLKAIMDWLLRPYYYDRSREFHAVRVNCDGHMKKYNVPQFEATLIKQSDVKWSSDVRIPGNPKITRLVLGLGLIMWNSEVERDLDARNPKISLLSIPCVNYGCAWGLYSRKRWGNFTVMRKDGKPLKVEYLKALCNWIDKDIRGLFNAVRKVESRERNNPEYKWVDIEKARGGVTDKITLQRFLQFSRGKLEYEPLDKEMPDVHYA